MTDSVLSEIEKPIEPITASADGRRNSYTINCVPTGQSMNYASCLWRQSLLSSSGIKTPMDWNACDKARCSNECPAVGMRQEEILAGKSIYFMERLFARTLTATARKWLSPTSSFSSSFAKKETIAEKPPTSMLDAIGEASSFAEAITTAASKPMMPLSSFYPGESPLQMARRLQAEKSTNQGQT